MHHSRVLIFVSVSLFVCFFLTVGPKVTFFQPEDEVVGRDDFLNGECEVFCRIATWEFL